VEGVTTEGMINTLLDEGTTAAESATASERSYCRTTEGVRSSCRKDSYYSHRREALWQEELNSKEEL
jgi:hypothetical protein